MRYLFSFLLISVLLFSCKEEDKDYVSISGQWRCEETATDGIKSYIIDIEKSSSSDNVYAIYNFNNEGQEQKVFPYLVNDSLIIETQFIGTTTISTEGTGLVSSDKKTMQLQYYITNDMGTIEVLGNCTHL